MDCLGPISALHQTFEKRDELAAGVSCLAEVIPCMHYTGFDIQGGTEGKRAVAIVL